MLNPSVPCNRPTAAGGLSFYQPALFSVPTSALSRTLNGLGDDTDDDSLNPVPDYSSTAAPTLTTTPTVVTPVTAPASTGYSTTTIAIIGGAIVLAVYLLGATRERRVAKRRTRYSRVPAYLAQVGV
jgi:hypothetical protein